MNNSAVQGWLDQSDCGNGTSASSCFVEYLHTNFSVVVNCSGYVFIDGFCFVCYYCETV